MSKKILMAAAILCAAIAVAAPVHAATSVFYPEDFKLASNVKDGDFVNQEPSQIFVLTSSQPYWFWAPLKLAVDSKIKGLQLHSWDVGSHSKATIYRVSVTDPRVNEEIVSVVATAGGNDVTNLPLPYHRVLARYRYYIKLEIPNDGIVQKVTVLR